MFYKFDPMHVRGTFVFLGEQKVLDDYREYYQKKRAASYYPRLLTVDDANQESPGAFDTYRDVVVFSEQARTLVEERAPGQVESIPVAINVAPDIAR